MTDIVSAIQLPDWLTKEFIQSKLRIGLKDEQLTIEDCFIKPAVAPGDNYASQLLRVTLNLFRNGNTQKEKLSLIVKMLPFDSKMEKFISQLNIFFVESRMFTETMPAMERIMEEVCPGKYPPFHAETYYHQGPPNDLIMMEDLCASGFKLANRFDGLDLEHSVFVLENLARFHASGYVLTKRDPSVIKKYEYYAYEESNAHMFTKLLRGGITALIEECDTWSDLPKTYVHKLRGMKPVILDKFFESYKRDNEFKINTIIHGDTWINNMMFKYAEEKLIDMRFVDFQVASYNSPALDVVHFMFTSPKKEVREEHYDLLLEKYYEGFMKTLSDLKHTIDFTVEEFKKEIVNRLTFAFVVHFLLFPISFVPKEEVFNMGEMFDGSGGDEYVSKSVFSNTNFKSVAKKSLPFFEKHGII